MRRMRHGNVLRVQVGFMLAFYALAVCRGLIPGLCATQNALDARFCPAPESAEKDAASCCARAPMPAGAEAVLNPGAHGHTDCAFCSLITTTVRPAEAPMALAQVPVTHAVCALAHDAPSVAIPWDPILRRGPPSLA